LANFAKMAKIAIFAIFKLNLLPAGKKKVPYQVNA